MADKIKDTDDQWLESMLKSESLSDNGFSQRVVSRLRRRLWLRRLTLPVAATIGGLVAARPLTQVADIASNLAGVLPDQVTQVPASIMPQAPVLVMAAALLVVAMLGLRLLEE